MSLISKARGEGAGQGDPGEEGCVKAAIKRARKLAAA